MHDRRLGFAAKFLERKNDYLLSHNCSSELCCICPLHCRYVHTSCIGASKFSLTEPIAAALCTAEFLRGYKGRRSPTPPPVPLHQSLMVDSDALGKEVGCVRDMQHFTKNNSYERRSVIIFFF